jgi:tetrahydromethanopterin S-methyltransferase subunit C
MLRTANKHNRPKPFNSNLGPRFAFVCLKLLTGLVACVQLQWIIWSCCCIMHTSVCVNIMIIIISFVLKEKYSEKKKENLKS